MRKIIIITEKSAELVEAWAKNIPGIYGTGHSINETKQSIIEAIEIYKRNNVVIPIELEEKIEIEIKA